MQNPILTAKSLWTISRFSEIIAQKQKELFLPLFKVASNCISKNFAYPVRMMSIKALGMFAYKIHMFKSEIGEGCNLWPNYGIVNPQIIIDIFDTINLTSEDTIHIILDTLTQLNKISSTYAPLIAELGSKHILHIFTLFNGDKLIGKLTVQLISQLSAHKEAFQKIYVEFSPFLLECFSVFQNHLEVTSDLSTLKPSDIQLMTSIFDVTSTFIKNCQDFKASENLISLLVPLLKVMNINEDIQLQVTASVCLKNFIKVAFPHITKNLLTDQIIKVIYKLLEVPKNSQLEGCALLSGNLVMITFNNLMNGKADPEILKQIVYKLYRSRIPSIVQGLVLVYARLIQTNPMDMVNFLASYSYENKMALKILIDKWLLQQPIFRGKSTKNITY